MAVLMIWYCRSTKTNLQKNLRLHTCRTAGEFLNIVKIKREELVQSMIDTSTNRNIKEPRITLVGAGPGDADLITLKGVLKHYKQPMLFYTMLW